MRSGIYHSYNMQSEKSYHIEMIEGEPTTSSIKDFGIINEGLSSYVKDIVKLAIPNTLSGAFWAIQSFICIYFVGLLRNVKMLDGFSLGYTWASVFGFSILMGIASGLETFISQLFGSKNYKECGLMFNKSFVIVGVTAIPCILIQFSSKTMFLLFGIDEEVSIYSYKSALALIPSIILYGPQVILEKFLINQQISNPQMIFQFINTLLCPLFCYLFMFTFDMGLYGVMAVRALTELIYSLSLILYMKYSHCCDDTLIAPSMDIFRGWWEYMVIAFPALIMTCFEWWAFEILNLFTGRIGVEDLGANVIAINYTNLIYLSCVGIALATGTLVGNSVGEHNIAKAKTYIAIGISLTCIVVLIIDFFIITFRHFLSTLFTTDERVIELTENVLLMVAFFELADGNQIVLAKTLIAAGRQKYASIISTISYYGVMIFVGIITAFTFHWKLYGIWTGTIASGLTLVIGYSTILYKSDWKIIIQEAIERNKLASDQENNVSL